MACECRDDLYADELTAVERDGRVREDLVFQAVSWHAGDDEAPMDDDADEAPPGEWSRPDKAYFIKAFGVSADGRSVSVTITDFTPYFYLKLDPHPGAAQLPLLAKWLKSPHSKLGISPRDVLDVRTLRKKDFWGFTNGEPRAFVRVLCRTQRCMRTLCDRLGKLPGKALMLPGMSRAVGLTLYESNIDPLLRFFHVRNLSPAGWIRIPRAKIAEGAPALPARCNRDVCCKWQDCHAEARDEIAPLLVASFDIECSSSHGDFPVAKKDYRKVALDLHTYFQAQEPANEFAAKEMLIDALHAPFLDALPPGVAEARPGAARARAAGMSRAFPKESAKLPLLSGILKRIVDDVYVCLRGRGGGAIRAAGEGGSKADVRATIVTAVAQVLNDALQGVVPLQGDQAIQIGTTFHKYGSREVCYRYVATLGTCDDVPGARVVPCATEKELLTTWASMMSAMDPDVVVGWNIFGFDLEYVHDRAEEAGCVDHVCRCLSRLAELAPPPRGQRWLKEQRLSSSALGDNILRYIEMHGRCTIDLMKVVQRDHKLDSYKLDAVAQHFLGQRKNDVSPAEIFKLQRGGPADRQVVAAYCVQDCALCNHLAIKLEILANNVGMANVCSVPLSYIFMRGQGVKIFSLVAKQCKVDGFLIPTLKYQAPAEDAEEQEQEGYEGAIVLDPKPGIYLADPVSVLDYASLYPSSMISENLSHDCLVLDARYDNLPGVEYLTITYEEGARTVACRFAQIEGKGVLPRILMQLLKARKATRKRMESATVTLPDGATMQGAYDADSGALTDLAGATHQLAPGLAHCAAYNAFQKAVLDGLQLAYKVTANSLYGQMGARTSPLYLKHVAACTTATGRKMILMAKAFLEENYCAEIVYGDSVAGYTPVFARWRGRVLLDTIEGLARRVCSHAQTQEPKTQDQWRPCREPGKQAKDALELDDLEVWSDAGWTRAHRLIRHRLAPHKRMLRVVTNSGLVDVTDDHSLLMEDGQTIVAPHDLRAGETLLHADPPAFSGRASLDGFSSEGLLAQRLTQGLTQAQTARLTRSCTWSCLSSGEDDRVTWSLVLSAPGGVRRAFWQELCDAIGTVHAGVLHLDLSSHLAAAGAFALATSLGSSVSVCARGPAVGGNTVRLTLARPDCSDAVSRVTELPEWGEGYVYDFTTDNHHFAAGVGRIVVHNTDSIFIVFPKDKPLGSSGVTITETGRAAILPSIRLATQASAAFKRLLKPPHDLEYEKTFWPWIIFSKKRYVGNVYEHDDQRCKQKSMGIVLKRRDNAQIVKQIYGGCIDIILRQQDIAASLRFLEASLKDLVDGKTPLEDLVITKTLRAEYKNPDQIAHQVLAKRMGERDAGNKPQVGDRVPFVYVECAPKGKARVLQGDRIEHPDYIRAMRLRPDVRFYLTNQIMKPVQQLYSLTLEHLQGGGARRTPQQWLQERAKWVLEYDGDAEKADDKVQALREAEAKACLFDPLLRTIDNRANRNSEITSFYKPASRS